MRIEVDNTRDYAVGNTVETHDSLQLALSRSITRRSDSGDMIDRAIKCLGTSCSNLTQDTRAEECGRRTGVRTIEKPLCLR